MKFRIIRGKRLLQQLISEASYTTLDSNTRSKMPPTDRRENQAHKQQILNMSIVPYTGSNTLLIKSSVRGQTNTYTTHVQFEDVEFVDSGDSNAVEITGSDKQQYFIHPVVLSKNNIKVLCDCLDFRWRFAVANSKANSLYGNVPPPYVKKTDRPPVNPQNTPGVCKHLIKTVETLQDAGLLS